MKRSLQLMMAAAAVCGAPVALGSTLGVQGSPTLDIFWQNGTVPGAPVRSVGSVALTVDEDGNIYTEQSQEFTWGTGDQLDTITVSLATGNFDPFLNFAVGVVDAGAASIFTFVYSSPVAPTIAGLANYTLDLAGSFSNGLPSNGGSLATALPNTTGVLEALLNGTVMSATGTGASFPSGGSSTYGPFAASGTFDCATIGGCNTMGMRLSFLGSGGSDAFSMTGRFEITEALVPVPAAAWLFASGLGVMGWLRRKAA